MENGEMICREIRASSIDDFLRKLKNIISGINFCVITAKDLELIVKIISGDLIISSEDKARRSKIIRKLKKQSEDGNLTSNDINNIRSWLSTIIEGKDRKQYQIGKKKPNHGYPIGEKIFLKDSYFSRHEHKLIIYLEILRKSYPSDIKAVIKGINNNFDNFRETINITGIRFEINLHNNDYKKNCFKNQKKR